MSWLWWKVFFLQYLVTFTLQMGDRVLLFGNLIESRLWWIAVLKIRISQPFYYILCSIPDHPVFDPKPSCVLSQTIMCSIPDHPVLYTRQSCVLSQTILCSIPDHPVLYPRQSCVLSQTILCSIPDHPVFYPRPSCVLSHTILCSIPDHPIPFAFHLSYFIPFEWNVFHFIWFYLFPFC